MSFTLSRARSRTAAAALAVIVAAGIALTAAPAQAATVPQPTGVITTQFEIDGNMAGAQDWNGVLATGTSAPHVTPEGYPSTGILDPSSGTDACGTSDSSLFVSGSKLNDNPWPVSGTPAVISPSKSDICGGGFAYELVDVNGQLHVARPSAVWTSTPSSTSSPCTTRSSTTRTVS